MNHHPPRRICVEPGCDTRYTPRPNVWRCPPCEARWQTRRNRERTQYLGNWRSRSKRARAAQPWCTRCGATTDLTLDHETLMVECQSCNSSHRRNPG